MVEKFIHSEFAGVHIADKNGAVVDILSKYPFGHSHSQLQLQIYFEKMLLTKQTCVLLSRRACVELTAVARFFTTEYEISGRVVTVNSTTHNGSEHRRCCLLPSPIIIYLVQLRVPCTGLDLVGGGGGLAIPSHPHHLNMREYDPSLSLLTA